MTDEIQALYDKRVAQALDETIASIPTTSPGVGLSELANAFANGGPDAFYAEKSRQVRAIQLRRFSERMVEDARLNAQRVKQRAWNATPAERPTRAKPLVAALTEAYGYDYRRVHSVGLRLTHPFFPAG